VLRPGPSRRTCLRSKGTPAATRSTAGSTVQLDAD
jgi:hypothetical protein